MRLGIKFATVVGLALHGCAIPARNERELALNITLSQIKDTRIKATVQNTGGDEVTFVHLNFLRDRAPVKKVTIYREDKEVAFEGIKRHFRHHGLTTESLTTLGAGEILEDEFDIATTSDLSQGGLVTLQTSGFVPIVSNGAVSGYIPYHSNSLRIEVDGIRASQVTKAIKPLTRRTRETCSDSSKKAALDIALNNTLILANAAARAALTGSASKFSEYFKTTNNSTRMVVAARLQAVAREAGSTTSGGTKYACGDLLGYCETNVLAYTLPSLNIIANCGIYYTYLPPLTTVCHSQDQATTSLHEFTHAPGVYSPGTDDLAYGYAAATALSSAQAVMNADTYALYANAINLGC